MFVLRALPYFFILLTLFTYSNATETGRSNSSSKVENIKPNNTLVEIIKIQPLEVEKETVNSTSATLNVASVVSTTPSNRVSTPTNSSGTVGAAKPTTQIVHYGREGEIVEANKTQKASEITVPVNSTTPMISVLHIETKTTPSAVTEKIIPISEKATTLEDSPTITGHGKIVPKKGVTFIDINNITTPILKNVTSVTNTVSTETTLKPKKPTFTATDEEPSNNLPRDKTNGSATDMLSIDLYEKNKEQNQKYNFVIPIVAVILSVPVVAIVVNILYKRGKEWWSHRHYARMDFLIDGMYNN